MIPHLQLGHGLLFDVIHWLVAASPKSSDVIEPVTRCTRASHRNPLISNPLSFPFALTHLSLFAYYQSSEASSSIVHRCKARAPLCHNPWTPIHSIITYKLKMAHAWVHTTHSVTHKTDYGSQTFQLQRNCWYFVDKYCLHSKGIVHVFIIHSPAEVVIGATMNHHTSWFIIVRFLG